MSTTDAFQKKEFAVPFILTLKAHDTFAGVNAPREKYFELSITSFFSTPMAEKAETKTSKAEKPKSKTLAARD